VHRGHDALGQRDLEAEAHVLDLAVERRHLPGAPRGEPAAEGGADDRGREVPEREASLVERALEALAHDAGLDLDAEIVDVDPPDRAEPLEIERDPALRGPRAAGDTRARAPRDDGQLEALRELEHARDLLRRLGPDDAARRGGDLARAEAQEIARPEVARVREAIGLARRDGARADDAREIDDERGARGGAREQRHGAATIAGSPRTPKANPSPRAGDARAAPA
jgi:hypothetical protein